MSSGLSAKTAGVDDLLDGPRIRSTERFVKPPKAQRFKLPVVTCVNCGHRFVKRSDSDRCPKGNHSWSTKGKGKGWRKGRTRAVRLDYVDKQMAERKASGEVV